MNQLVHIAAYGSPALVEAAGERAQERGPALLCPNPMLARPTRLSVYPTRSEPMRPLRFNSRSPLCA
jgi:hypothetical protein